MSDSLGRPFSPNEIENSLKFNLLSSSAVFCVRCFCPPLMMSVFTVSTSEPMSPSRRLQHCNARRKLDRCSLNRLTCAYICSLGCQFTGSASASSRDKGTVLAGHQTLDTLCFQRVQTTWLVKAQAHDQAITWKRGKKKYLWWICLLFVWPPQKKKKRHPGRLYFDSGPQRNSRSYSINFPSGLTATMSWAAGRCTSSLCAFCAGLIWYTAKKHLQGSAA